jgi:hypothetical protein
MRRNTAKPKSANQSNDFETLTAGVLRYDSKKLKCMDVRTVFVALWSPRNEKNEKKMTKLHEEIQNCYVKQRTRCTEETSRVLEKRCEEQEVSKITYCKQRQSYW